MNLRKKNFLKLLKKSSIYFQCFIILKICYLRGLDKDIETSGKRWQLYVDGEAPENDKLPQDWKNKSPFQKLCIIRALRTDRMIYAAKVYVQEVLGLKYTNFRPPEFSESFKETSSKTPVFFILSSGVDPTRVNI